MTTVAVTGASGYMGRRLVESLDGRDDVGRVVGIDIVDPDYTTRNLEFYRLDVRSDALADVLTGCDVVYHLAFALPGHRDPEEMRDINVGGTHNVLNAAVRAGVGKIVHLSSAMAYGAHPDNDFPLTESSPIRPVLDFAYSAHKAECEELLTGFMATHPETPVTILRPAVVLGPTATGIAMRLIESPVAPRIRGYEPPVQVVHETDVARALLFVLDHDLAGAFNVAPDDHVPQRRAAELLGKRFLTVEPEDVRRRMDVLWRAGLGELPASYLPFLMYPWIISSERLRDAGFSFLHGTESTLLAAGEASRGWISLGRLRFRPRSVVAAVAGTALVAGSIARRVRRGGRT